MLVCLCKLYFGVTNSAICFMNRASAPNIMISLSQLCKMAMKPRCCQNSMKHFNKHPQKVEVGELQIFKFILLFFHIHLRTSYHIQSKLLDISSCSPCRITTFLLNGDCTLTQMESQILWTILVLFF